MSKLNKYGELNNPGLRKGEAELIAIRNAEKSGCTKDENVGSCFWVVSSEDRDGYYEIVVEGHASCAHELLSNVIRRYRVKYDRSFNWSQQQGGSWKCPNCKKWSWF